MMPSSRFLFLAAAFFTLSGFSFRCILFCTEQTSVQANYTKQRDDCRDYAQTTLEMIITPGGKQMADKDRKAKLVSLFSDCMSEHGWTVPDGKQIERYAASARTTPLSSGLQMHTPPPSNPTRAQDAAAYALMAEPEYNTAPTPVDPIPQPQVPLAAVAAPVVSAPTPVAAETKAIAHRTAQCSFARYAASSSSNAAKTAEACDLECADQLEKNPGGELPAACPPDPAP